MLCTASLVSSSGNSPMVQSNPSVGFTFTPSIPLIEEAPGEAAIFYCYFDHFIIGVCSFSDVILVMHEWGRGGGYSLRLPRSLY